MLNQSIELVTIAAAAVITTTAAATAITAAATTPVAATATTAAAATTITTAATTTIAAAATTAATTTTTAAIKGAFTWRAGFADADHTAGHLRVVQFSNRFRSGFVGFHFDKTKSLGATGIAISNQCG
jgi:hypothetical protein